MNEYQKEDRKLKRILLGLVLMAIIALITCSYFNKNC